MACHLIRLWPFRPTAGQPPCLLMVARRPLVAACASGWGGASGGSILKGASLGGRAGGLPGGDELRMLGLRFGTHVDGSHSYALGFRSPVPSACGCDACAGFFRPWPRDWPQPRDWPTRGAISLRVPGLVLLARGPDRVGRRGERGGAPMQRQKKGCCAPLGYRSGPSAAPIRLLLPAPWPVRPRPRACGWRR